jgi:hypothetical protein
MEEMQKLLGKLTVEIGRLSVENLWLKSQLQEKAVTVEAAAEITPKEND